MGTLIRIAALLVALTTVASIGFGQETTANLGTGMSLLEWCQRQNADLSTHSSAVEGYRKGYCEGMIRAVAEAARAEKEASVPSEVSLGQLVAVVNLYLEGYLLDSGSPNM